MPIDIIDSLRLASDIPLDVRYRANTYLDVSLYWYEGMQVYQYFDRMAYLYDGSVWIPWSQQGVLCIDLIDGGKNWANPTNSTIIGGIAWTDASSCGGLI